MLRYLKRLLISLISTMILLLVSTYLLADFFVKIKLYNYFKIEDLAFIIMIVSIILVYFNIRLCRWFFKRLQNQQD